MQAISLTEFLPFTKSQEDVSLIVAKDEEEQQKFITILQEQKFRQVQSVSELLTVVASPAKAFYVLTHDLPIEIYEFMEQYPNHHISIIDRSSGNTSYARPVYKDVSLVFITTKKALHSLQEAGYSLFDKVGLTYQNNE